MYQPEIQSVNVEDDVGTMWHFNWTQSNTKTWENSFLQQYIFGTLKSYDAEHPVS